jgi:hypothetical protein
VVLRIVSGLMAIATLLMPAAVLAEVFVDAGLSVSRVQSKIALRPDTVSRRDAGLGIGVGVRRAIGERSDIGVRLEVDRIDDDLLLAVRALDYRYHISDRFAVGAFIGAARLDLATPAYGYWAGFGGQWKDLRPNMDLGLDVRYGDKVARDNLLPSDPQGGSPDNFHDISSVRLYFSFRF